MARRRAAEHVVFALAAFAAALAAVPAAASESADGWTVVEHPAPPDQEDEPLRGIWAYGNEVWAVGHAYADMSWQPWGVRCTPTECTPLQLSAAGDSPVATATAIDGTSATDVWVVGRHLIKHYGGSTWKAVDTAEIGSVAWSDVDAVGPADAWAVGTSEDDDEPRTVIARWDGTKWLPDPAAIPAGCGLGAEPQVVAAANTVHVSTTCDGRGTVLWRVEWGWLVEHSTRAQIHGLDLVAGRIWATGSTRTVKPRVWRERDGSWRRAKAPTTDGFITAMAGTAADDRWVVGGTPSTASPPAWFVAHWDGTGWTASAPPPGTEVPILYDVVLDSDHRPWAVGGETHGCPHPNCGDDPLLVRGPPPRA